VTTATVTEFRPTRWRALGPARDALAICGRNLIAFYRVPRLLLFSTIQPLVFVFLFRYVFGGVAALAIPGIPYVDFLMPGVFVQVAVFGAMNTAVGLASDLQTGLLERFASLPMARSAVLAGRTLADLTRNVFVVALRLSAWQLATPRPPKPPHSRSWHRSCSPPPPLSPSERCQVGCRVSPATSPSPPPPPPCGPSCSADRRGPTSCSALPGS